MIIVGTVVQVTLKRSSLACHLCLLQNVFEHAVWWALRRQHVTPEHMLREVAADSHAQTTGLQHASRSYCNLRLNTVKRTPYSILDQQVRQARSVDPCDNIVFPLPRLPCIFRQWATLQLMISHSHPGQIEDNADKARTIRTFLFVVNPYVQLCQLR